MSEDSKAMAIASKSLKNDSQHYGWIKFYKAREKLVENKIAFEQVTQGLKFELDGMKYIFWSLKNRVYCGNDDTGMTMIQFLKHRNSLF